jgi:hypothetical protein
MRSRLIAESGSGRSTSGNSGAESRLYRWFLEAELPLLPLAALADIAPFLREHGVPPGSVAGGCTLTEDRETQ